jgi:hypothetical protein
MSASDITAKTTHDLWIESRQFSIEISRPTPTTIELKVTRPNGLTTVDGVVVLLSKATINGTNYPDDGKQYVASTDWNVPGDTIEGPDGAHVVGFYSAILNSPMPAGVIDTVAKTTTFSITITNTQPTQIYYASVHGASNILQYYPVGIQSYPLEGSHVEKGVVSFAGSIPSLPEAPTSPSVGTVYHDLQLNLVQYWDGTSWIPSRSDTILTGNIDPGVIGQTYIYAAGSLYVFSGVKWTVGSPTNLQFKIPGPAWVPFVKVSSNVVEPTAPAVGEVFHSYTTGRTTYWDGMNWVYANASNALFNTGSGLVPAFVLPTTVESSLLMDPYIGQLFYNTTTKALSAWTGSMWKKANTDQEGTPISDKIGVGNDGSYDERIRLIKVLKAQLGWPQSCIELAEEQFNVAIDNALDNYRMWCDAAYRLNYIMFPLVPNQQTYFLNNQTQKTDRIVNVMKIHRLNVLGIETANGNDAVWSSGILTSYYSAATVDILSLHLLSNLSEEFQRIFAGELTFLWDEPTRELFITRKVYRQEKVILECTMERSEQEIMVDRWSKQFIQNWALAECKEYLGMIRSRFSSGTPGAAGTITQNGELLLSEARQDMAELKQSALDYEWGGHIGMGNVSFLIG